MATLLPDNGFFNDPIDNGQGKDGLDDIVAFVRQSLPGGASAETNTPLEISGGSLAPTEAIHAVDTEGQAATDELDRVAFTDVVPGQLLLIRALANGRVPTVKHNLGGVGQFLLHGNVDFVLDSNKKWLLLRREGDDMVEVTRSWGDDQAGERAHLGLGDVAPLNAGDGLEESGGELQVDLDGVNSGLFLQSSGLSLDVATLPSTTTPAPSHVVALENGAGSNLQISLLDLFEVFAQFVQHATLAPDDRMLVFDNASGVVKYIEGKDVATGWEFVSETTFNTGAGITIGLPSDTDYDYRVLLHELGVDTDSDLRMILYGPNGGGAGGQFNGVSNYSIYGWGQSTIDASGSANSNQNLFTMTTTSVDSNETLSGVLLLHNFRDTARKAKITGDVDYNDNSARYIALTQNHRLDDTGQVDSIGFNWASGLATGGTIVIQKQRSPRS